MLLSNVQNSQDINFFAASWHILKKTLKLINAVKGLRDYIKKVRMDDYVR